MKRLTESSPTSAFNDSSLADDDFFVNNAKTQLIKSIFYKIHQDSLSLITKILTHFFYFEKFLKS